MNVLKLVKVPSSSDPLRMYRDAAEAAYWYVRREGTYKQCVIIEGWRREIKQMDLEIRREEMWRYYVERMHALAMEIEQEKEL